MIADLHIRARRVVRDVPHSFGELHTVQAFDGMHNRMPSGVHHPIEIRQDDVNAINRGCCHSFG
jgi:hypothetical protein